MSDSAHAAPSAHPLSERGLLSSAWWMAGSHLIAQAFAYGSLILLARWLPPASFGTVAVGTAIVYVAVLVVDRGTFGGIVVQQRLTRKDVASAFWRCLLVAVGLAVAMATMAGALVDLFASGGDAAAMAFLAMCLPLHAIAIVPTALLQKTLEFRRLAGVNAVANVVSALVAVLMGLAGWGVWALVARQLILAAVLALLASVLCLTALRALPTATDDAPEHGPASYRSPTAERWFFLLGVALVLTINLDSLVIGGFSNAGVVGLYALAFTIAMAPSTHFSEQVGKVLFAATASRPETSERRTEQSVRLMSMLLLPLLPVGILVAPTVLPGILGPAWDPMVVVFQVLLVVGVGHAIVNCIGEALAGTGHIAFRAKAMVARCAATLLALGILVPIDGLRGAALAQLVVFVPYAAVFATAGARRAGTSTAALWRQLRPVATIVGVQLALTLAALVALAGFGMTPEAAAPAAAMLGFAACVPLVFWTFLRMRSRGVAR